MPTVHAFVLSESGTSLKRLHFRVTAAGVVESEMCGEVSVGLSDDGVFDCVDEWNSLGPVQPRVRIHRQIDGNTLAPGDGTFSIRFCVWQNKLASNRADVSEPIEFRRLPLDSDLFECAILWRPRGA